MIPPPVRVKVWGDFACFTRPEFKVERVTYPVMTPSAARGVLEAIFWKPEFTWRVRRISVLNPISHFSIQRNEVSSRMSPRTSSLSIADSRTQRHTLALRDVAYVIEADVELPDRSPHDAAKYRDQFRRRVSRGQCFHRPYLGCREFSGYFGEPSETDVALADLTQDVGLMLLDIDYGKDGNEPSFFDARLESGILCVPSIAFNCKEVRSAAAETGR
jgi:CRISPR-associated protein Cas5d